MLALKKRFDFAISAITGQTAKGDAIVVDLAAEKLSRKLARHAEWIKDNPESAYAFEAPLVGFYDILGWQGRGSILSVEDTWPAQMGFITEQPGFKALSEQAKKLGIAADITFDHGWGMSDMGDFPAKIEMRCAAKADKLPVAPHGRGHARLTA